MTTTDETPHISEASLHRAVPRYPVEHKHFTPSSTPFSVWFVKVLGYSYAALGASLILVGGMMMYAGNPKFTAFMGPITSGIGLLAIAVAAFLLAAYHVAKAVIDVRDMMRHRGS
jgi:hypothetical protein